MPAGAEDKTPQQSQIQEDEQSNDGKLVNSLRLILSATRLIHEPDSSLFVERCLSFCSAIESNQRSISSKLVESRSIVQATYRGKVATLIFSDAGIQIQMEYKRVLQGN
jgi:hypothetical protein